MTTNNGFMWDYQPHFRISAQVAADAIFTTLDERLRPTVFLVGVAEAAHATHAPVQLEPEDCGYTPEVFQDVEQLARQLEADDQERELQHADPIIQTMLERRVRVRAVQQALQTTIRRYDEERSILTFCSAPVLVQGYMVSVVLQLDRATVGNYYALTKDRLDQRVALATSLLDAATTEFLEGCADALTRPEPGSGPDLLGRDADEVIRAAGKRLMYTPAWAGGARQGIEGLFHACNTISSMRYEGAEGVGKMLIARREHPNVAVILALAQPIPIKDHRAVRKLLEISSAENCLLTDAFYIYGFGNVVGEYDPQREDLFLINFTKHYTWELQHADHVLMRAGYGQPQLPQQSISREQFQSTLRRIFRRIGPAQVERLWRVVREATRQKHGTMVVVSTQAEAEAERLSGQAIKIEPIPITPEIVHMVTAIDGAVIIDEQATCYAIGVILDGIAAPGGSSARGARYNSAIRYVAGKTECLAIVVSVDGSIDLIPELRPQIARSELLNAIAALRSLAAEPVTDVRKFHDLMGWLSQQRFYLLPEMCHELNALRRGLEQRFPQDYTLKVVYPDFVPDPEMNAAYFLEE
jgi:hypothetical protein